jgi:DMSO/TMAO reductase YedYZ molybdopterin-dependent catalytic subunit
MSKTANRKRSAADRRPMTADPNGPPMPQIISPDTLRSNRVPPGQSLTTKWPVLHYGSVQHVDPRSPGWSLKIFGACENPYELKWDDILALPQVEVMCDMHCVTHWSRLDNVFTGPLLKPIIEKAKPRADAKFVMCHAEAKFTTNVPLDEFTAEDCILAHSWDHQPLTAEHGGPLRGLVPRLYLWKSAKWIRGIELRTTDAPGFWEQNGYHMHGDPWTEERFGW